MSYSTQLYGQLFDLLRQYCRAQDLRIPTRPDELRSHSRMKMGENRARDPSGLVGKEVVAHLVLRA